MDVAGLKTYYNLTKPGIVWSNTLAAIAGYLFGSAWVMDWTVFGATILGTALVIACACVLNNYIDRGIDAKMARTSRRALVTGDISAQRALWFAAVLGVLGLTVIIVWATIQVALLGVTALLAYVVLYGWAKRRSVHGTLVGTISGSLPLVTGYAAATGRLDIVALLLFLVLAAWQMAHFYSIATFRMADYRAAGLPMLPVVKGMQRTKLEIVGYIILFVAFGSLLSLQGYVGVAFVLIMLPLAMRWLWQAYMPANSDTQWGRRMFGASLSVLLVFFVALSLGSILP